MAGGSLFSLECFFPATSDARKTKHHNVFFGPDREVSLLASTV